MRTDGHAAAATHWASFAHEAASVPQARHVLRGVLHGAGVQGDTSAEVEIVLSEIVGNAVRHALPLDDGDIHVRCAVDEGGPAVPGGEAHVEISVTDGGSPGRVVQAPCAEVSPDATSGRGLAIVDGLAHEWGVVEDLDTLRRTVWATFGGPRRALRHVPHQETHQHLGHHER